ncbi:hypothetical protein PENFLA_c001G09056 [Penicillium flavigenum]|uniref:Uncharacterized protein n=1 Tax=Penicillium flavigenum TaxID=254877 RepID=A0A1V6U392_9EURO|nr:hypothetical protein PENFLA_c001G09056 [Penicillium flavigenum]
MSHCGYDCSAEPPALSPDGDITGIGIVTNYIGTASIALLVIIIYYLGVFQPSHDPFEKDDQIDDPFRPNPVDEVFLRAVRWAPRRILKRTFKSRRMSPYASIRLQQTFINCLLAMSDLQIVTGFSILISGFAQLRCGLAAYHWLFIIKLAWFSSLTQLSCLTVLRSHLYRFSTERLLRLLAMGGLATFLVVGLLSTGNSEWDDIYQVVYGLPDNAWGLNSPAICHIWVFPESPARDITFLSALVSVILIGVAFFSRVIKLHKALSVGVFGRARKWLSIRARRILRIVFDWACKERHPHSLRRSICYRPLLAVFLTACLVRDAWSSVLFEVIWLLVAFGWGIVRILWDLSQEGSLVGHWTFGQVVAVVLLAAPFITMMQYFNKDTIYSRTAGLENVFSRPALYEPQATRTLTPLSMDQGPIDPESPDGDWDSYTDTLATSSHKPTI